MSRLLAFLVCLLCIVLGYHSTDFESPSWFQAQVAGPKTQSQIEASCGQLWVDGARNDPSLFCYLDTDERRFCLPEARQELAAFISRYDTHRRAFDAALVGYLLRLQLSYPRAIAKTDDPAKAYDDATKMAAKPLQTDAFSKGIWMSTRLDIDITTRIKELAAHNLLSPDDFGWFAPDYVTEAFEGVVPQANLCDKAFKAK